MHEGRIEGPGAWTRASFEGPEAWTYALRDDFSPSSLAADAAAIRRELLHGRGFVVVRGLPIERCSAEEAKLLYQNLGMHLGRLLQQNVRGERLYEVRDEGYKIERDYGAVGVRFSKTAEGLHFHTDSAPALMGDTPDFVGLLALQTAKSGGSTRLVSALTLHNVMRAERPDLLARLYQPYHFDRRAELRPGEPTTLWAPVFSYSGSQQVRYFRFYIPKGHEIAGEPLSPQDVEALDYMESVMNREELQASFDMRRGDMQFVNNNFILHSRTAFEDHPEPELRRRFVRLWLKAQ